MSSPSMAPYLSDPASDRQDAGPAPWEERPKKRPGATMADSREAQTDTRGGKRADDVEMPSHAVTGSSDRNRHVF